MRRGIASEPTNKLGIFFREFLADVFKKLDILVGTRFYCVTLRNNISIILETYGKLLVYCTL